MRKANDRDKSLVTDILSRAFDDNLSVNYLIPQDARRNERIRGLMKYSFDVCRAFGEVFLSDDRNACALVIYPEKKRTTFGSLSRDARLILSGTGPGNIRKILRRELLIKKTQQDAFPQGSSKTCYLWFIGVNSGHRGQGKGSRLLEELIVHSRETRRLLLLETSTLSNLPWYERFGLKTYARLDLGYTLYFLSL